MLKNTELRDRVTWSIVLALSAFLGLNCGACVSETYIFLVFFACMAEWTSLSEKFAITEIAMLGYFVIFSFWLSALHYATNISEFLRILCMVWVSDISAYFVGRSGFMSVKLWPTISPNKSLGGSLGSLMFCAIIGTVLFKMPVEKALLISVTAQAGDLVESAMKRLAGVKDSNLELYHIPGHGGVLDRVDGLLFTLPCLIMYKYY